MICIYQFRDQYLVGHFLVHYTLSLNACYVFGSIYQLHLGTSTFLDVTLSTIPYPSKTFVTLLHIWTSTSMDTALSIIPYPLRPLVTSLVFKPSSLNGSCYLIYLLVLGCP
jgi:hypothetical protein